MPYGMKWEELKPSKHATVNSQPVEEKQRGKVMPAAIGWISAAVIIVSISTCTVLTLNHRVNLEHERITRCETNGGQWDGFWSSCSARTPQEGE